jgi:flavin-binding protein dodecin
VTAEADAPAACPGRDEIRRRKNDVVPAVTSAYRGPFERLAVSGAVAARLFHRAPVFANRKEVIMADTASTEGVYRVIDVVGSSDTSWEDAARNAVETASRSLRDLRIAEVQKLDLKLDGDKIVAFRTRLQLSFKYEPED